MATDHEFVAFMDGIIELGKLHDKATLLEDFKRLCPSHRNLSGIAFKKWIDTWAEARGYVVKHYKSSSNAMVIVSKKP